MKAIPRVISLSINEEFYYTYVATVFLFCLHIMFRSLPLLTPAKRTTRARQRDGSVSREPYKTGARRAKISKERTRAMNGQRIATCTWLSGRRPVVRSSRPENAAPKRVEVAVAAVRFVAFVLVPVGRDGIARRVLTWRTAFSCSS